MIIYPPLIADTIPAFLYSDTEVVITVPFTQNPVVPAGIPLQIQIKDYFSSTIITKSQTAQQAIGGQVSFSFKANEVDNWPIRTIVNGKTYRFPVVGQYYKIQIAYDDGDENVELTYSSAVLGKCIDNHIDLNITDVNGNILSANENNVNPITYVGNYIRNQLNEPLYSYRFDFKNEAGEIIETSGEIVWNNQKDKDECVFEGQRISKNTPIKLSTSLSNQYNPVFTSYVEPQSIYNLFDMDGKYIDNSYYQNCTYYSDTILLSDYLTEIYDGNNYFRFNWDDSPNTPLIYTGLGSWTLSETDFKMLQKYPICATKSIQIQKLERDTVNNLATIEIGERSLTISSIYQSTTPTYNLRHELQMGQTYTMTFSTTTINGYQDSISVNIIKGDLKEPNFPVELAIINNKDTGANEIQTRVKYAILNQKQSVIDTASSSSFFIGVNVNNQSFLWPITLFEENINFNQIYPTFMGSIRINSNISSYTNLSVVIGLKQFDIAHSSRYLPEGEYIIIFENFYQFYNENNQPEFTFDSMKFLLINTNQELGTIIRQYNNVNENISKKLLYNDNTITFGETYKYGWQENYEGMTTIQWYDSSSILYSDYMFLSDKDKQLKISFNPKVSSMKETILETKQDTIGGKYPIFYRNGQVRYREIPISGLISYLMDDYEQFATNEELGLAATDTVRTTNLTNYNIIAERKFREKVLNWLNDGKPKLFRSMTEGTFIVRLMNVSLSPNDTVGRMIWTFSATAYEIDENTYDNLKKHKLIETEEEK